MENSDINQKYSQLSLFNENLQAEDLYSKDKYIVIDESQKIVDYLMNLKNWNNHRFAILYGEKFSGKSHLSYIAAQENNGIIVNRYSFDKLYDDEFLRKSDFFIIDEINNFDESVIFHAFNHLLFRKKYALFVTNKKISEFSLPDLKSRLSSIPILEINFLNKNLAYGILIKIFSDYDIVLDIKIVEYIVNNIDLSFKNIEKSIVSIKDLYFTKKEKLTLNKLKKVLSSSYN
jgi:chromosomal replication initiation ATPase DnaA